MSKTQLSERQRNSLYEYLFGLWRTNKELGLILFPNAKNVDSSISQHLANGKSAAIINFFLEQMTVVDPNSAIVELDNAGEDTCYDSETTKDLRHLAECAEKYLRANDENAWVGNIVKACEMIVALSCSQDYGSRIVKLLLSGIVVLFRATEKPSYEAIEQISDPLERALLSCQANQFDKELQDKVRDVQNACFSRMSDVWKHAMKSPECAKQSLAIYSKISGREYSSEDISRFSNTMIRKKQRRVTYTSFTKIR